MFQYNWASGQDVKWYFTIFSQSESTSFNGWRVRYSVTCPTLESQTNMHLSRPKSNRAISVISVTLTIMDHSDKVIINRKTVAQLVRINSKTCSDSKNIVRTRCKTGYRPPGDSENWLDGKTTEEQTKWYMLKTRPLYKQNGIQITPADNRLVVFWRQPEPEKWY